jgi:hypothetical protein
MWDSNYYDDNSDLPFVNYLVLYDDDSFGGMEGV